MLKLDDYQINNLIFKGTKTESYRGLRNEDQLPVILQVFNANYMDSDKIHDFYNDYVTVKSIEIDEVLKYYDYISEKNTCCIVQEYFEGVILPAFLVDKKLAADTFLEVAINITTGLGNVHENNIIHNKFCTSNIMINKEDKRIKILDFSLASSISRESVSVYDVRFLDGELHYISPEQTGRINRPVDYRTDFYSLGVTLYEIITGEKPFDFENPIDMINAHIAKIPSSPFEKNNDIPKAISNIIMKLMNKDPQDRYQSHYGILYDLKACLMSHRKDGQIKEFSLAEKDISYKFQLPDKLYGRQADLKAIGDIYTQVKNGENQFVVIKGEPGVGKTSLAHEFQNSVLRDSSFVTTCKFENLTNSVPYYALIQGLRDLVNHILTGTEILIETWKNKFLEVLGDNGQIMIDVIPELEIVIGPQSPVQELLPEETRNRFNLVFQSFILAFADKEHPLIILLDDLQWADITSLLLLKDIISNFENKYILVLTTVISSALKENGDIKSFLKELTDLGFDTNMIELTSLGLEDIENLICDTLYAEKDSIQELARICYTKTKGNAFFIHQFLTTLNDEEFIYFNKVQGAWDWHLDKIRNANISDNVVDLMLSKIHNLDSQIIGMLQLASCSGDYFSFDLLENILGENRENINESLKHIVDLGLIIKTSRHYKFSHERIRQTVYFSIDDHDKKMNHLKIARFLYKHKPTIDSENMLFTITSNYNLALELVTAAKEKQTIIGLNHKAGLSAKAKGAFAIAFGLFKNAVSLFSETCWEEYYEQTLDIYVNVTETSYLSGDISLIKGYFDEVNANTDNVLDKVGIYEVYMHFYMVQNNFSESINIGLQLLKLLGVVLPKKPSTVNVMMEAVKVKALTSGKKIEDFYELPELTDPYKIAATTAMALLGRIALLSSPELSGLLVFKSIQIFLKNGNSPFSSYYYALYGSALIAKMSDIDSGYRFGQLAIRLTEKYNKKDINMATKFIYNTFIDHWKNNLKVSASTLRQYYHEAIGIGDLGDALAMLVSFDVSNVISGKSLLESYEEIEELDNLMKKTISEKEIKQWRVWKQVIINLTGNNQHVTLLKGEMFDEDAMFGYYVAQNNLITLCSVYIVKMLLHYQFGEYDDAVTFTDKAKDLLDNLMSVAMVVQFHFYDALIYCRIYESDSKINKRYCLKRIKKNIAIFKKWMKGSASNISHKYYVIKAELARVLKDYPKAEVLYEKAIKKASENDCINEEALINELTACYYLNRGKEKIARLYFEDAYVLFHRWGALAKVNYLKETYTEIYNDELLNLIGVKLKAYAAGNNGITGLSISDSLDLTAIIKSCQILSGEIVFDRLLNKLLEIVVENVHAEKGVLMLCKDERWVIVAESTLNDKGFRIIDDVPVEEVSSVTGVSHVPCSIVNYAIRTKKPVILDDGLRSDMYGQDAYILANKTRSILTMPLVYQSRLIGVLYLENNISSNVFNHDRVQILDFLSSQISISLENARVYQELEESRTELKDLASSFARFVPKEFLTFLNKKNIQDVAVGDNTLKEMTILFSDIREFTSISEKMSPKENFDYLNFYFQTIGPIVREKNGFIDKYIGDAIMALFPRDPVKAIEAAIEMKYRLTEINERLSNKPDFSPYNVGIGIHTGRLILGTVGENNRMETTVISDAVNLASRLEGLTKIYNANIIISMDMLLQVADSVKCVYRFLDIVRVRGRTEPIPIFEILDGLDKEQFDLKQQTMDDFDKGIVNYRKKEFTKAIEFFKIVLKANKKDRAAYIYYNNCRKLLKYGVPENWDGVLNLNRPQ